MREEFILGEIIKDTKPEERKVLYETVIGNIKQCGSKYFASVPISILYVDPDYQRIESRSMKKIERLTMNWDPHKMNPITGVNHPEEYRISITDGLGRLTASQLIAKPLNQIECEIIMDAPTDPAKRKKFEAYLFASQSDEIEVLKPIQKHNARLILEDKAVIALDKCCKKYGVTISTRSGERGGAREAGTLTSYKCGLKIAEELGENGLNFCFSVIKNSGWNMEVSGYSKFTLVGLSTVYKAHANEMERQRIGRLFAEMWKKTTPRVFKATAISYYPGREPYSATIMYMEDLIVTQLEIERKIGA